MVVVASVMTLQCARTAEGVQENGAKERDKLFQSKSFLRRQSISCKIDLDDIVFEVG
jgi:hypothetical protein